MFKGQEIFLLKIQPYAKGNVDLLTFEIAASENLIRQILGECVPPMLILHLLLCLV